MARQRDSVMWILINFLYRGYIRARLVEMRQYHLVKTV